MRTASAIKNTTYVIVGQVLSILLSIVNRTAIIQILGIEYLGISGLFANILSLLSLTELGVASSFTFALYKPLAENDAKKVASLMMAFKKVYTYIGCLIGIVGLSLTLYLDNFIKSTNIDINISIIYIMYVINATGSYFFSYKRTMLIADQKGYINTANIYIFEVIRNILQIIVLIIFMDYYYYLAILLLTTLLSNILISLKIDSIYPYLIQKDQSKLDIATKSDLKKNITAMMLHRIGGVLVLSTDNLIISKYFGLTYVGLYSNYLMIINVINTLINQIICGITASVGNLNASDDNKKSFDIFNKMFFIMFWIYSFVSISFMVLLNPFISLWIGKEYCFTNLTVFLIVLGFYIQGMRQVAGLFKNTMGLFRKDRFKPLFEGAINIIVSIWLAQYYGIDGVFIGTIVSAISTGFWIEPYLIYKYKFNIRLRSYFYNYFKLTFVALIAGAAAYYFSNLISNGSVVKFIFKLIICIVIPSMIYAVFFRQKEEFVYMINIVKYSAISNKIRRTIICN